MATVAVISDKQLEAELQRLATEAVTLRKKIDDDTRKLNGARSERARIMENIAHGRVKAADVVRSKTEIEAEIEGTEIRIKGHNSALDDNRNQSEELTKELGRRQAEAARIVREKEFAALQEETAKLAERICEQLTQVITGPLAAFDANRRKLGKYADLGGMEAAQRVREMLFKNPGPSEPLHNSNVHLRRLLNLGWVPAGKSGPSYERLPGGELILEIWSMRPRD